MMHADLCAFCGSILSHASKQEGKEEEGKEEAGRSGGHVCCTSWGMNGIVGL